MIPGDLTKQLASALGEKIKCLILYGSAAAGDFVPGASNYNLLLVVDPLTVAELDALHPPLADWHKAGHAPPLLFTPEQLAASTDAFPIELLDIRQSREILYGTDLLAALKIEPHQLRLQVERELTGKLLRLRRRYVLTGGKPGPVTDLMLQSLSTFLVLFRAALRLYESTVPDRKLDALHALAKHISFDTAPFERLFAMKPLDARARKALPQVSFSEYLTAIEQVAQEINRTTHKKRSEP